MRVKLQFVSNKPIVLPVHYLYSVHQLVYKLFTPAEAHTTGRGVIDRFENDGSLVVVETEDKQTLILG